MPEHNAAAESGVMTRKQAFAVLGLGEESDWNAVRTAYSARMKELHPDTGGGGDSGEITTLVEAFRVISRVDGSRAANVFTLGEQALHGETPRERAFACSRLASLGRRTASAYLRRALFDSDERVAVAAATGIGTLQALGAADSLAAAFGSAGPGLRAAIMNAAIQIGPRPPLRPLLIEALRNPAPQWRKDALRLYMELSHDTTGEPNGRSA